MPRVLILLPASTYRAPDFMRAARALGVDVVVASDRRQTLADVMGDRALTVNLRNPERSAGAIAALAQRLPLDAVVGVDDQGVVPAALASERLGLPTNAPAAVGATRDKAAQRRAFTAAGLPQPRFALVRAGDDVGAATAVVGFPCVVKPLALSGSRGVIRVDDERGARAAVERVRAILAEAGADPAAEILVEQYVPGREVAVEGLLRAGALEVLAVFDKPDPLEGPYFEETLYVTPSRLSAQTQEAVTTAVASAARALGLAEGPVHAELRVGAGAAPSVVGPRVVLELAARSIGGLCARALRFGAGISLEEVILRHALRLPLDGLEREQAAAGVMMLPIPRAGILRGVGGQDAARAVPGVVGLEVTIPPGRPVRPLPEGDRYLGFLFARADTPEQVEQALRDAHAALRIDIEHADVACGTA